MTAHGCAENGLLWANGQLGYDTLRETISEAVSGYAFLYAYGIAKTKILTTLVAQPVRNLEDFDCPQPQGLKAQFSCSMLCHKNYLNFRCATRNAHTLFKWLKHHLHPAPISPLHPNLHAIPPRLIRVYHVFNDVIFFSLLQLYKTALTTYQTISSRLHFSKKAAAAASTSAPTGSVAAHNL